MPNGIFPTYNRRAWRVIWLPCGKLLTVPPGTGPPALTGIWPAAVVNEEQEQRNLDGKIQCFMNGNHESFDD